MKFLLKYLLLKLWTCIIMNGKQGPIDILKESMQL